jgi:cell division protease FtsH
MSDKLGPLTFGKKEEQIFLGKEIAQHRNYSESIAVDIDNEIRRIVDENCEIATKLLADNIETLKRIAENLLERETLDTEDLTAILNGEDLRAQAENGTDASSEDKKDDLEENKKEESKENKKKDDVVTENES